ncbi:zinc-binding dehydrogenase [Nocardioides sp.]|uniref:zinc-binding dehydrogenase n=1 Tax=Nocardioides sp. TaxID=35761 RepID=UPI0039E5770F
MAEQTAERMAGGLPAEMWAWCFAEHGDPAQVLALRRTAVPVPGPGQLLVAVEAAAVNFADGLIVRGDYQSSPPLPAVSGMELAGSVVAGAERPLSTRVAGLGAGLGGGFAEYAVIEDADAFEPPALYSATEAACFTVAYQTAWFALHVRGCLTPGETVLVHSAAGGVGLAAVQLAAAAGARVLGVIGSVAKAPAALAAGCEAVFLRGEPDLAARIKDASDGGVDLVVDPVGGESHTVSERVIRFAGRIVLVGFASGDLPVVRPDLAMVKNYAVVGLHWGRYRTKAPEMVAAEYARLVDAVTGAGIRPLVSDVLDFQEVPAALARVTGGGSVGRVAVTGMRRP